MPGLRELQRDFRAALLTGEASALAPFLLGDDIRWESRLDIHRNNVRGTLSTVLVECFPAVRRIVDARFFDYAADAFLRARPPVSPCLHDYGADFPDFLANFAPCHDLPYLPDVAWLEWLLHRAAVAAETPFLGTASLAAVTAERTPVLRLHFHPAFGLLQSPWPVEHIWEANRPGQESDAPIDLGSGGVRLEVMRRDGSVRLRSLDAPTFAFRRTLHEGVALEAAAGAVLALDPDFDLAAGFSALFGEGLVTELST